MEKERSTIWKGIAAFIVVAAMVLVSGYVGVRIGAGQAMQNFALENPQGHEANDPGDITEPLAVVDGSEAGSEAEGDAVLLGAPSFLAPREYSLPDLFDFANPAVVAISTEVTGTNVFGQRVSRPASGSGFLVSADGYIVTNEHVISDANSITVLLHDGSSHTARLIGSDAASDLAVIKIDVSDMPYLALGDSDAMRVGEQVAAIGNPLGQFSNSMTVGYVSALNREIVIDGYARNKIQTDAAVNRGNSGGPLLNLRGEVIGVINAKSIGEGIEGLGFAIPANEAKPVIEQLIATGHFRTPVLLGVEVREVPHPSGRGFAVQIFNVNPNGSADRAGILPQDIILSADGVNITNFNALRTVLRTKSPGDEIELRLLRDGKEITITAVLDANVPAAA